MCPCCTSAAADLAPSAGISGNDHGFWSIVNARKVIGYTPEDNSAVRFIDAINVHVKAAAAAGKK